MVAGKGPFPRDIMEPWVEENTLNAPKRAGTASSARMGFRGETIAAPTREAPAHLDVGLQVLSGRADAGPRVRPAAWMGPDFMARRRVRFGPMASQEAPFEEGARRFRGRLHDPGVYRPAVRDRVQGGDRGGSGPMFRPRKPGGGFPEIPPRKGAVS